MFPSSVIRSGTFLNERFTEPVTARTYLQGKLHCSDENKASYYSKANLETICSHKTSSWTSALERFSFIYDLTLCFAQRPIKSQISCGYNTKFQSTHRQKEQDHYPKGYRLQAKPLTEHQAQGPNSSLHEYALLLPKSFRAAYQHCKAEWLTKK